MHAFCDAFFLNWVYELLYSAGFRASVCRSQLRVGSPWSQCGDGDATDGASDYKQIGTIIPVYLGNPSAAWHSQHGGLVTLLTLHSAIYVPAAESALYSLCSSKKYHTHLTQ